MSRKLQYSRFAVLGVLALAAAAAPALAGPVTVVDLRRSIGAYVSGPEHGQEQRETNAGGTFNESVSVAKSGAGYSTRAWADIESLFNADGFHFLARHGYEIEDNRVAAPGMEDDFIYTNAGSGAGMIVHFHLDAAVRYTFAYESHNIRQDLWDNNDSPLTFMGGGNGFVEPGTGILTPGDYELRWGGGSNATVGRADPRASEWEYDLSVTFAPLDDGGNGPSPIPLPPALWSGLAILSAGALMRLRGALV